MYYFRVNDDSTVHINQGSSYDKNSGIAIPIHTFESIKQRANEAFKYPQWIDEQVVVGYEDNSLILRFTQRFNLYILGTLIAVIVVGGSLLAWLWWRLSKERRRREALAQSRRYLAEGREKERERLAQEIHDGPVQDLHGLHMLIKSQPSGSDNGQLPDVGDELMRVTRELRAMSADLHPPALERFGLGAALRSHADRLRDRHADLEMDLSLAEDCGPLPDEYALSVFRIAQEAMNNAAQHGQATHIQMELKCDNRTLHLEVRDDGDGFTPPDDWHALAEQDHYGLLGMRERAGAIGAALDIDSVPGNGTRVCLQSAMDASPTADDLVESPLPA